jgi:hypothetical protein
MSIIFGTFGLSLVLCNPSNNNKFFHPSMMKPPVHILLEDEVPREGLDLAMQSVPC